MPINVATYPSYGLFALLGQTVCLPYNTLALFQRLNSVRVHLEDFRSDLTQTIRQYGPPF